MGGLCLTFTEGQKLPEKDPAGVDSSVQKKEAGPSPLWLSLLTVARDISCRGCCQSWS